MVLMLQTFPAIGWNHLFIRDKNWSWLCSFLFGRCCCEMCFVPLGKPQKTALSFQLSLFEIPGKDEFSVRNKPNNLSNLCESVGPSFGIFELQLLKCTWYCNNKNKNWKNILIGKIIQISSRCSQDLP